MPEAQRLTGRAAVITGGGQGIGRAIAIAMVEHGASVTLVDQNAETVAEVCESLAAGGGRAQYVTGSVGDRDVADRAISDSVSAFGSADIVVNCAHSYTPHASLEEISDADFNTEIGTGFFGTVHFMQAAFPHMRERGYGSIINFGSQVALAGDPKRATYVATKEAIRGMSRTAARDWGRYKIRVNVICPMAITPAVQERVAPEILQQVIDTTALGYFGQPDEIAPVAVFLASDDAGYVTGQTINVDGGRWMF
jgi:NAD(P)-dependent dehydrogenase (short-subunit alcohol dehydrogenase family)